MAYKIRKRSNRKAPIPVPEALPGRGDKPWKITHAEPGYSKCRFTEDDGGELSVPLTNEPCDECGKNHAASARLHELAHAALSPDINKVRTHFRSSGERFDVNQEGIILAEELRADYQAARVAKRRGIEYDTDCDTEDTEQIKELVVNGDFRQLATEILARSGGESLTNAAMSSLGIDIGTAEQNYDTKTADQLRLAYNTGSEVRHLARQIKRFAREQYEANIKSWSRQLHVGYSIDRFLEAAEDSAQEFRQDLSKLKQSQKESHANPPPMPKPDEDLAAVREKLEGRESPTQKASERFVEQLWGSENFKQHLENHGPMKAERIEDRLADRPVEWGDMETQAPPLTRRLPIHKRGWTSKASDEGAIPMYMHRWPIDQSIFRAKRREQTGSVLIDVSGSMSLSTEQVEDIVKAAPAGIIAIYSGTGNTGILRVIGNEGKWQDFLAEARKHRLSPDKNIYKIGMAGGNQIDKPALEWLAKQPLPRIWVSDGQVVSPSHGFSTRAWEDCESVIKPARINRVETPEEAARALEGKLALWR